jgi:phosphoribosyl 1,2-cyclic phosphodiesterase
MRITILASGSKGNATLFETPTTRLLVDAGVGVRALQTLVPRVDVLLITHAHSDHVGYYERIARKLRSRVLMTEATRRAVEPVREVETCDNRGTFAVRDLSVTLVPLPHDAAQVGVVVSDGPHRAALLTDLGEVPPGLVDQLAGCEALLVEANHDLTMLDQGPYRDSLKKRIRGPGGHLSNKQTRDLLAAHYEQARPERGAHTVVLMHLSEVNNTPRRALDTCRRAVPQDTRLLVAPPREPLVVDLALGPAQAWLW